MGYCYDLAGRLACDACGAADGNTRKRQCPERVHYPEGGSLPYCPPPALCRACNLKLKPTLHKDCVEGARISNARHAARGVRLAAGELEVKSAWGAWHDLVPEGYVGVLFQGKTEKAYRLVPASDYKGGDWLSEYAAATTWEPHA